MPRYVEDTLRYQGLRKALIGTLRQKNIRDTKVLRAIRDVPRHLFVEKGLEALCYEDRAFPIAAGQTISQPYTVAFQSQLLNIYEGCRVLEIGTGSGYQASILAHMGAEVYTIERQRELYQALQENTYFLSSYKHRMSLMYGDGYEGFPDRAPYNQVLITAACEEIPQKLFDQLAIGGYMVLPLGSQQNYQVMKRITKQNDTEYSVETFATFQFVPMLKGVN